MAFRLSAELRQGDLRLEVALEVPRGTCLAIVGPSGAGKTTLLRVAAGLARPDAGLITNADEVWLDTGAGRSVAPERRDVGYVFQDYALFAHMSAWRNVAYGLRGGSRAERRARAEEALRRFGLGPRSEARPGTLSGGERQRVALARALARRPSVLLLDEPLSALDARTRAAAAHELAAVLADTTAPALLVTHDFEEAALLGDRIAVLDAGRIVQEGAAADLLARPAAAFVAGVTGAVVLRGTARAGARGLTEVALDGGGTAISTDPAEGPVAIAVHPWEIAVERAGVDGPRGSPRNRLPATVSSVTPVGNRLRVGLAAPQPLVAELTGSAVSELELAPGTRVVAAWKATATRVISR